MNISTCNCGELHEIDYCFDSQFKFAYRPEFMHLTRISRVSSAAAQFNSSGSFILVRLFNMAISRWKKFNRRLKKFKLKNLLHLVRKMWVNEKKKTKIIVIVDDLQVHFGNGCKK